MGWAHGGDSPPVQGTGSAITLTGLDTPPDATLVLYITAYANGDTPLAVAAVTDSTSGANTWLYSTEPNQQYPPAGGSYYAGAGYYGLAAIAACITAGPVTSVTARLSASASDAAFLGLSWFTGPPDGPVQADTTASATYDGESVPGLTAPQLTPTGTSDILAVCTAVDTGWISVDGPWTAPQESGSIQWAWSISDAPGGYSAVFAGTDRILAAAAMAIGVPAAAAPVPGLLLTAFP